MRAALLVLVVIGHFVVSQANTRNVEYLTSGTNENEKHINKALLDIFSTPFGTTLAKRILHCNTTAIENFLGTNIKTAHLIAGHCLDFTESFQSYPEILNSPLSSLKKTSLDKKRQYNFLTSLEENSPFDSWTSPTLNSTTIVVPVRLNSKTDRLISYQRLLWILAHETAINFDAKFWTSSISFREISSVNFKLQEIEESKKESLFLALDNPLISQVFAFYRAFRIEQIIMAELLRMGKIESNGENPPYSSLELVNCNSHCFLEFLAKEANQLADYSLPLLAFSPHYRSQLWQNSAIYMRNRNITDVSSFLVGVDNYILEIPTLFFKQFSNQEPITLLVNPTWRKLHQFDIQGVKKFVIEEILVHDLAFLKSIDNEFNVLSFFRSPLLSGQNIRMSSGPRPRIIIGSGLQ